MTSCRLPIGRLIAFVLAASVAAVAPASAAELADARKLYDQGKYAECIEACTAAVATRPWDEGWWLLKVRAELTTGQYPQSLQTYENALRRHDTSIRLRLLGYDALRANDRPADADALLVAIRESAARAPWRYGDAANRVALGRTLLRGGADARQVLDFFFENAKKDSPSSAEPYLASGELALEKHDYALAAEAFANAAKRSPDDPDAHYGLARAYDGDGKRATAALAKALELNPRHVPSLLFQAENAVDREDYARAEALLAEVLEVNPKQAAAWAYRAVLAHLGGDEKKEAAHRAAALRAWTTNPEVDHLIGMKLSQKYRFAEGQAYQRRALEFVPSYRPAKVQLCQDLLRLGKEEEGWRLADEVFAEDKYNVVAYNLITLHDSLSKFRTIENEHFLIRMEQREAEIYGQRVMRLLMRAKQVLCEKYAVELPDAVVVEIFPRQKDFAIRTFGLPGGEGFLGVCFGDVITVNSPASQGATPSNWEAVLWHEFCHAVTLKKTRNKMPRWLSEGISVYEEREQSRAWGQTMNPRYREMVLEGAAVPVSKLSGAFLSPPTPMHLQFAYYESSMVVEYVVGRFGLPAVRKVLDDLGDGTPINAALAKHTEPIEKLDGSFAAWLKERAEELGPKVDWEWPELPLDADSAAMAAWNKEHPDSFFGLLGEGRALLAERKFQEAEAPLEKAVALYPGYGEAGGPYLLLAAVYRETGEAESEREMLEKHVALDADAVEARLRLADLATADEDWKAVREQAEQVLAVNPLVPAPHRALVKAAEATGERSLAIEGHRTLLLLDPLDRAEHHHRLARLLVEDGRLPEARKEVVMALEEAPRYRAAHQLLLEIVGKMGDGKKPASGDAAPTPPAAVPSSTGPAVAEPPAPVPVETDAATPAESNPKEPEP